ncbi:CHASE4 domain-containing protein [Maridesulfovibrio sp.]|uniref:sensor histidine kinase n=1 Tax=Maridesulfovibrio sp. TaxID=2795000 RepID=UPI002A18B2E5|nr:CHASE4 domain-containing protein [Maridesulfovibrio sp.]
MRLGLNGKSVVGVFFFCAVIFFVAWLGASLLTERSSGKIEKVLMEENLTRASYAISAHVQALENSCRDWAWWDDSYEFMEHRSQKYIESNLTDDVMINLNLDLLVFFDRGGRIYVEKSSDEAAAQLECFEKDGCNGRKLINQCTDLGKSGLIRVGHKIMMVSVQKVLNSNIEGPSRGTMLMGRFFGDAAISRLGDELLLKLAFSNLGRNNTDAVFFSDVKAGDKTIQGFKSLDDIFGRPLVLLRLEINRDAYRIGSSMTRIFVICFLGAVVVIGIATGVLVNLNFVTRVKFLQSQLKGKYFVGPYTRSVLLSGNDELTDLSVAINKTLERLQEEREKAIAASKVKSEFLANMSHELRTPMHSILGMVELLNETDLNEEQREFLKITGTAGEALLSIINDVLEISKIEAGHLEIEHQTFLLREMVGRVVNVFHNDAVRKNIALTFSVADDVPEKVVGDPARIRQVLNNLISNAIKFTSGGSVAVELSMRDDGRVLFSVRDSGIGISGEKIGMIFDSFTQADSSTSRKYGGTGLGLPISRKLVSLMGGEMNVQSKVGEGSVFSFYVKLG